MTGEQGKVKKSKKYLRLNIRSAKEIQQNDWDRNTVSLYQHKHYLHTGKVGQLVIKTTFLFFVKGKYYLHKYRSQSITSSF